LERKINKGEENDMGVCVGIDGWSNVGDNFDSEWKQLYYYYIYLSIVFGKRSISTYIYILTDEYK
jgi:hypothetical protein